MITRKNYNRVLHVGFWIIFMTLSTFLFSNFWPLKTAVLRALLNGSLFILVFYINLLFLIPHFFSKKRYILYGVSSVGLIVFFFTMRILFRDYLFGVPAGIGFSSRPYQGEFLIITSFIFIFGLSIFYELARNHFDAAQRNMEILRQRNEAEFRMLKAQVNPHFLFNTLNNLYSLAYERSEKTAGAIMSLAEIMRYLVYEAGASEVPVEKEIRFLTNYVELEKLRIEDPSKVTMVIEKPSGHLMVFPLIFIAYVENAFKHSCIDTDPEGFIQIFLSFRDGGIFFTCENSIPATRVREKDGGLGLVNARARLDLMCPGKSELTINSTSMVYHVNLTIRI
ncbi:MAG: sensor histidine kinase [Bacteroidales bacterium]|nr:sensor histidine kinase [Bacteroidales bacterium]